MLETHTHTPAAPSGGCPPWSCLASPASPQCRDALPSSSPPPYAARALPPDAAALAPRARSCGCPRLWQRSACTYLNAWQTFACACVSVWRVQTPDNAALAPHGKP
eukprot:1161859-Pelagomonas_calceolata.AAC.24